MNLITLASHTFDADLMPAAARVLDVGCRWFDFSDQVLDRWVGARVIAMDPARDVLPKRGDYDARNKAIEYMQCALVGHGPTFQRFAHFSTGEGDFITTAEHFHDAEMYEVPTMRIKDVMVTREVMHFDLVKLDCEGSEFGILEQWPGPIATQISVEFHDWDKPQYRAESYYDGLWKKLPWYRVVQHELSKQGEGVGHWDSLLVLRQPEAMKHGDFVTNCYGQARALGTEFARFHGRHDTDEWVSLACFQLVMAAQKFTAPEQYADPSFWAFAKAFIWRRLTDSLRTETNRGKRDSQGLDPSTPVSHDFTRRSDAAVTLSLAMPFLTKTQKRWLDGVLLLGVVTEADAEVIGMKLDAFRWHRRHTILRIREVLS